MCSRKCSRGCSGKSGCSGGCSRECSGKLGVLQGALAPESAQCGASTGWFRFSVPAVPLQKGFFCVSVHFLQERTVPVPAVPVPLSVSGQTLLTVPVSGSGSVPEPPCFFALSTPPFPRQFSSPKSCLSGTSDLLFLVEKMQPAGSGFWGRFWTGLSHRKKRKVFFFLA